MGLADAIQILLLEAEVERLRAERDQLRAKLTALRDKWRMETSDTTRAEAARATSDRHSAELDALVREDAP